MKNVNFIELINDEPKISYIAIAENTNNLEKAMRNLINKYKNYFEEFGQLFFKNATVKNSVGAVNEKKTYYLNEQQTYLLLTFMRNSKIVIDFKVKLVDEFFKMREFIHNQTLNEKVVNLNESK